jgi:hypothetical protein
MSVMVAILIRVFIHVCADCNFNQKICPYQFYSEHLFVSLMISSLIRACFCRILTYASSVYIELVFLS